MSNQTDIELINLGETKNINVYAIVMLSMSTFFLFLICFYINYKKCK